ncbi:MAG TPA: threonine ammonia-lyase [Chloroflexota bacterium]|nr:threonine ammonia-lyase [Chloroflexota bacterium]
MSSSDAVSVSRRFVSAKAIPQDEVASRRGSPASWPGAPEIDDAARLVAGVARRTPLLAADELSALTGWRVHLKAESLQPTGSYKLRGAYVRIMRLDPRPDGDRRARGVICASAGNHGQGVALAARLAGAPATVVLPRDVPVPKLNAIEAHGARVVLHGDGYDEACAEARRLAAAEGLTFVHPFDDWDVICGQATVGSEILDDLPDVDAILAPVGGGGLLAGIALAARARGRTVRLIGVQAAGADAMAASLAARRRVTRPADTVADGIKVREPGKRTFAVIRQLVERIVTVQEEEIYRAVVHLLEKAKLVVEPAGAVGVAALLGGRVALPPGSRVALVLSGGNVDPNLLIHLTEYGLAHAGRYLALRARLPDRPGQLVGLLQPLAELRVNVVSIEHHRAAWGLPADQSEVLLQLETRGPPHKAEVVRTLRERGYDVAVVAPS